MMQYKPRKLIDKKDLNNFDLYSNRIKEYPIIEKFMRCIFKKWIETLPNPLEIPWIYQLYENRIGYLEKFLQQMEGQIGEENIERCLQELFNENTKAEEELFRKTESIAAELMTFAQLTKMGHKNLRKIFKIGDIESDTGIISIKSILDLDINYKMIENLFRGLSVITENEILRKIDFIRLYNGENVDYRFLDHLINFLEDSLVNSLEFLTRENKSNSIKIEIQTPYNNRTFQSESLFTVSILRLTYNSVEKIFFNIEENRRGKKKHKIEIKIENVVKQNYNVLHTSYDTNGYCEGEEIGNRFLNERIKLNLAKIDNEFRKAPKSKSFIGWINLSISPMHEAYVQGDLDKIEEALKGIKENRDYQIVLCLTPIFGFDLKEPKMIIL
ncbi:MAG: hypothetical protein ACTSR2_13880 [Candidatus Hodarchaeales archaeon]